MPSSPNPSKHSIKPMISSLKSNPMMPKSPPGFPSPQYSTRPPTIQVPYDLPHLPNSVQMSPFSANVARLTAAFGDADVLDEYADGMNYLAELDPGGQLDIASNGADFAFYKSRDPTGYPSISHSAVYQSGHGRTCCDMTCKDSDVVPHNCGHHTQWKLPLGFEYCSSECKGGLCGCLKDYSGYGYYG